ncbi:MAG: tetratricopeptide repeat protein [Pyrinomonadaceae bacterium]
MKRLAGILAPVLCVLLAAPVYSSIAKDSWISVRSKNFTLVGNASERDIREVASRLEQFRSVFTLLFPKAKFNDALQTKVVVFKSDNAFKPFKPLYNGRPASVAGYFQPGPDVNYIALTSERRNTENPYSVIFHEFVHLLVENNMHNPPAWFNEGLAEFYSSFEISDGDKKITLGKPIVNHVLLLRENKFIPLQTLFAVNHASPLYNERSKQGIFYAESWALVHYLLLGNNEQRKDQFLTFLKLLSAGKPVEESFPQAFQTDFAHIEKELAQYINHNSYPVRNFVFNQQVDSDKEMQSAPVSEAEAQSYLGDLLLHSNRLDDAESYLNQSLTLDADLAPAHSSLGLLRARQKRFGEAKEHLQRAASANTRNYLIHYYYAYVLSREGMDEGQLVSGYAPELAEKMRGELRQAIKLAPDFPESYHLLAFINLVTGEQLVEATGMMARAISLKPGREDFALVLGQIYLRRKQFNAARNTLAPLARTSPDPQLRARAADLIERTAALEEQSALARSNGSDAAHNAAGTVSDPNRTSSSPPPPARPLLKRQFEGTRARGLLSSIECNDAGIVLSVQVGGHTLRLHNAAADQVKFVTYMAGINDAISCGARNPANTVLVTYRPAKDARAGYDGEAVAVEFVPEDVQTEP